MQDLEALMAKAVSDSRAAIANTRKLIEEAQNEHDRQVLRELLANQEAGLAADLASHRQVAEGSGPFAPQVFSRKSSPGPFSLSGKRLLKLIGLSLLGLLLMWIWHRLFR